jgi:hypothetical protein
MGFECVVGEITQRNQRPITLLAKGEGRQRRIHHRALRGRTMRPESSLSLLMSRHNAAHSSHGARCVQAHIFLPPLAAAIEIHKLCGIVSNYRTWVRIASGVLSGADAFHPTG